MSVLVHPVADYCGCCRTCCCAQGLHAYNSGACTNWRHGKPGLSRLGSCCMQSIPVGCVTNKARDQDPAWAAASHIFYGERACDFDDDTPKW